MLRLTFRFLLHLLPADWDAGDRAEMLDHFEERVRRSRGGGGYANVVVQLQEVVDLARSVARVRLGSVLAASFVQDVRIGLRGLRRAPLVTAMAVACLALGIGATTAVFSAVDVWVLRPLPVHEPDRLVNVVLVPRTRGLETDRFHPGEFVAWREAARKTELAAWQPVTANLSLGDRAVRAEVVRVSANFLDVLGLRPRLGRGFFAREERNDGPRAALLSHAFWSDAMDGDPAILGRSVILNGETHAVVGVLPPAARFGGLRGDVWVPQRFSDPPSRTGRNMMVVGRVSPGTTVDDGRTELRAVARRLARVDSGRSFPDAAVRPFRDALYGDVFERVGSVLAVCVLFVLLIACANVSSLLLARGVGRSHEMAVRASLGAGRGRLVRQLLTESLVVAALGGLIGLGAGWLAVETLVAFVLPDTVPGWSEIAMDGRILAVAAVATLLSAVLCGLAPALRGSRTALTDRLAYGRRTGTGRSSGRLTNLLVSSEVAMALVLLTSTGVLVGSLARLDRVEMGFRTDDAIWFGVLVPPASEPDIDGVVRFQQRVRDEVQAIPGAGRATLVSGSPYGRWATQSYSLAEGDEGGRAPRSAEYRAVATDYADVMDMRVLAGRWFSDENDVPGALPTAVVSRVLAEAEWGSVDGAVGRRLDLAAGEPVEVVGVVEAGRLRGPQLPPPPAIFRPLAQRPRRGVFYILEVARDPFAVLREVREVVRGIDPTVAVHAGKPIEAGFSELLATEHIAVRLLAALAGIALVLTLVGVYGVVAHTVRQRHHELGLRVTLGADPVRLTRAVVARTGRVAVLGLVAGGAVSLLVGRVLAGAFVGVRPGGPALPLLVALALLAAVLLGAFMPARRTSRVDPVECFRDG